MSLIAAFAVARGSFTLEVELEAPGGQVTAVLGPNGAGKTTLLRAVTGGLAVDSGSITLDGVVLDAPPDRFVVPERRRLGFVQQDHLLFPHLSARANVAFGPRAQGVAAAAADARAAAWLERFGLADRASLKPASLSGGQAQRVALARALAADPAALLLDEPLAALDAGTRVDVRRDLRRHLDAFEGPTLLVTHDPVDALTLADRVVILESGRVGQTGPLAEVTSRPRSRYVADLIGTNLLHGSADGTTITTDAGEVVTVAEEHRGAVLATVAPTAVALHRSEPEGSPRNRWRCPILDMDLLGDRVRVRLGSPSGSGGSGGSGRVFLVAEITPAAVAELGLGEGDEVWASVKATEVVAYPA